MLIGEDHMEFRSFRSGSRRERQEVLQRGILSPILYELLLEQNTHTDEIKLVSYAGLQIASTALKTGPNKKGKLTRCVEQLSEIIEWSRGNLALGA